MACRCTKSRMQQRSLPTIPVLMQLCLQPPPQESAGGRESDEDFVGIVAARIVEAARSQSSMDVDDEDVGPSLQSVEKEPNTQPSGGAGGCWWDWDSDWSSQWGWRTSQQEEASSSQAPKGAKGSGAAEAPARPRRPLRTAAPGEDRGRPAQRAAEPEKGKGKTGPSVGRPASESGSRTPRRGEKGAGKPTKGKPAKGAAQPAKGKAAQAKGAEQPAKGKPAQAGKSGKGKPATQEPAQGSGKKKNHRGGRSEAARANREARGAERREREGTDPVVLVEGPGTDIPEPRTPEQAPPGAGQEIQSPSSESSLDTAPVPKVPVFTGPAPLQTSGEEEPAERVAPPASAEAAVEPAEEAKPAGQEQAAPVSGPTAAAPEAEPEAKPRSAPAAKAPTVKAPRPCLGPPPPLREERKAAQPGPAEPEAAVPPAPREEAPEEEQEPTSPGSGEEEGEESEESSEGQGPCQFLNGLRHAARNRLSSTLQEMSQQPAYPPPQGDPVVEAAIGELSAQRQQGLAAAAATAAVATAAPAPASQASGGGHLLKSMYPAELEVARKCKVPLQMAAMTEEVRTLSVRLFGMLGSWTQDSATAVKLARGVKGQNGFELWRLLWQEHNPENESKNFTWRRTLLMPKFPPKESDFSLALQEWEADVDRYASEYGAGRALADEDLRAVLVTESPNALRQHLAMHAASLSTYAEVREVVVSYLQAKIWTPSARYAASSRRDPNAMDIGRIGDRDGKEGKGKGDKGKKGDKDHKKGKGDHDNKGQKGDKKGNQQGSRDGKDRCPICWKTGEKAKGKGNKGQVAQVADDAATTLSTASLATAGPSASQAGGSTGGSGGKGQVRQVRDDRILGVRFAPPHDTEPEEDKILKVSGSLLVDSGACVSVCRPEAFPDLQPAGPPKSLYSVDNSRLKTKGRVQPSLLLGEERQSCKVNFEVTEDIEDEILSISRAVEAGAGIWLHRGQPHFVARRRPSLDPQERVTVPPTLRAGAPAGVNKPGGTGGARATEPRQGPGTLRLHPGARPREVEDAAMEAAADEEAEAAEEEEAAGNPAPLEEQAEQPDSRPRGLRAPRNPTAQERAEHELTHTPYQAWCEKCVEGKAREDPHRRREPSDDPEEASLATVLNLTDRATGWTLSVPVAHKGHRHAAYAAGLVEQFVDRLGYDKFTLQADQENAIVRTWLSQLRADYPALEWDTSSNLFPWLVRHVAWLQARFGTKSTDGVTPYRAATGTDYGGALICSFGETVLAKLPRPGNKAQVRWVKGVWAGKLERDDSHVVLTEAGALNVRSVRRLPPETRHQTAAVLKACGLPWNPRFGRAAPAERSEPMMVPIPLAMPAEEVERLEPPGERWLFSDGPRPDDEALLVEGAEQASRLPDASHSEELANADIPDYEPSCRSKRAAATSATAQAKGGRSVWQHIAALADPPLTPPRRAGRVGAFTPVLRSEVPRGAQLFRAKWVDKCDKGRYKSRCTCADVKARYSPEQEAGLDVFVPTPTPESHSLLEVAALHNEGWVTRSLDIAAAFLIGKDRGAAEGRPVYMHVPVEWRELFDQWVLEQPAKDQQWYRDHFRDFVFRVDGNLYGRRTAGSVYRDELEEVLTGKLSKDYDFQRGVKDPCVFLDRRSGLILLHHIDDIPVAGPKAAVLKFTEVDLPAHCEITVGELEEPGTAVEVLGKTKVRTEDSILTLPDSKHAENVCEQLGIGPKDKGTVPSRPLDLTKVEELSAGDAAKFRSAVGSAIYLSADRRDIQFAVKELARRMQNPRVCDWLAAETLARYLRATPRFGRVVVLDPASKSTALLNLEVYSDSDWAGCPETRRSTDNIVACLGGAVIQTSCQTQPGLPATSSGDAEIRGVSRAAREAVFLRELAEKDFALACGVPRLWADSVRQSLPSMGMVDLDAVAGATEALAQKGTIKSIQASPWKMCRRDRQEPEPEDEIEHHAERAEEPPRAQQRGGEQKKRGLKSQSLRASGPQVRPLRQTLHHHRRPQHQGRRCRGPELSGDDEHLYETARGDKIHLFTNCNGLSSVPPDQVLIGFRCHCGHCAADPQNSEFLWTGLAFQVATGRVVRRYHGQQRGCPFMEGATIRHRVCLHCRNGHQSTKPGSAVNNSRQRVPPP
ncbi:unnamed protein product [Symbiodinium sp. CCMP2592]|nr:unnamed protein product [Symbiodinium sp. CCMP2592]